MKELNMLVFLTQLGISVAAPLGGFTLIAVWLRGRFHLGAWVIVLGVVLGLIGAADGLIRTLRIMEDMDKRKKHRDEKPPISFNDHL